MTEAVCASSATVKKLSFIKLPHARGLDRIGRLGVKRDERAQQGT